MVKNKHQRFSHWIFIGSGIGLMGILFGLFIIFKLHVNTLNTCMGYEDSIDKIRQRILRISQTRDSLIKDTEHLLQQISEIERGCYKRGDKPLFLFEELITQTGVQLISVDIPLHQTAKNSARKVSIEENQYLQQSYINIVMLGTYDNICRFICVLHRQSMYLSINRMSIKPSGHDKEDLVFEIDMSIPLVYKERT